MWKVTFEHEVDGEWFEDGFKSFEDALAFVQTLPFEFNKLVFELV